MIYRLEELRSPDWPRAMIDGLWQLSRPVDGPFIRRVRAAWEVLRGRADAFTWPGGQ